MKHSELQFFGGGGERMSIITLLCELMNFCSSYLTDHLATVEGRA